MGRAPSSSAHCLWAEVRRLCLLPVWSIQLTCGGLSDPLGLGHLIIDIKKATIVIRMNPIVAKAPDPSPLRVLLGEYHLRLLGLLLLRPEEDFHLREIERLTRVPASSARRELQRFAAAGLVQSRRVGNQVRYQAVRSCVVYHELASMLRKTVGMADLLREALTPLEGKIRTAFLFGSAAQGREGPYSDIDLMVIGNVSFDDVVQAVHGVQGKLGREVNPVILRQRDFKAKLEGQDAFIHRVMAEPKIAIFGVPGEFGKPA